VLRYDLLLLALSTSHTDIGCHFSALSSKTGRLAEPQDGDQMADLGAVRNGHAKQFTETRPKDRGVPQTDSSPKRIDIPLTLRRGFPSRSAEENAADKVSLEGSHYHTNIYPWDSKNKAIRKRFCSSA